jgi:hypothetical protein
MTEHLVIFRVMLEISLTILSLGDGSGVGVATIGQKGLGLLCMGMDASSGLQREDRNARCIARLHFGCGYRRVRNSQRKLQQQLALFTTEQAGSLRLRVGFPKTCFKHRLV